MSYEITIKANAGTLSITATGDVPDGEFIVHGHTDQRQSSIEVEQHDELGKYVIRAGHHHAVFEIEQAAARPAAQAQAGQPQIEEPDE